jgi:hypothetical protein
MNQFPIRSALTSSSQLWPLLRDWLGLRLPAKRTVDYSIESGLHGKTGFDLARD